MKTSREEKGNDWKIRKENVRKESGRKRTKDMSLEL